MNTTGNMKGTLENWVTLDLETAGVQQRLSARQGDSLVHKIVARLTLGGKRYNPSGVALAQFYGLLADGSTVTADGVIRADGAVEFIPGGGFFSVGGPVIVRVVLRDGDGAELYSPAFAIDAEYCFAAGTPAVPAEEYSRIEEMLVATLEAQKKCEAAAQEIASGIVNDLATNAADKSLSAAQGAHLKALIDAIKVPANVSELENDAGFVKSSELDAIVTSPLKGKKIVYDGDSICSATYADGGYAKMIADRSGGSFVNLALDGGRLTTAGSDGSFHSVVDCLDGLPTDGDLYCFEGGVNDVWNAVPLGTYSMSDYTGDVDKTTICGALETVFRYCLGSLVGKPVCFVITHKVDNISFEDYKNYHDAAVAICNKYSIPYYDAYNESGLNGWNTAQSIAFLTGNASGTPDGCHPNAAGYKRYYVPQLTALFEKIMAEVDPADESSYTNALDEAGYERGVYLSGQGATYADANAFTTGYIPITNPATIYLKNVTMPDESSHGNRIAIYDADKNFVSGSLFSVTSGNMGEYVTYGDDGNLARLFVNYTEQAYIRISAWGIDETSVISVNEPIL